MNFHARFLGHILQWLSIKSLRSVYKQRSFYGSENGVKLLLRQRLYAPFLRYTSVVKTFNAYSGCSLCPTLFYLGYLLGPGSLSLLVFVRGPQLSQNRRYSGNAIDRFRKPRPPSESSWNLHILRKVWLIFKYALLEGLNYTLAFVPCLQLTCNRR